MKTHTIDHAGALNRETHFIGIILVASVIFLPSMIVSQSSAPIGLGAAAKYAVLAHGAVLSTGTTLLIGDLGVSSGTEIIGSLVVNGAIHIGDDSTTKAQFDLAAACDNIAERTAGAVTIEGNLGGRTLTPGLYSSLSSLEISSGDLTLDAQGDANAIFIFRMASTLTTTSGRQVILRRSANACNIFWQVGSSATLGMTSVFKGSILALANITMETGVTLDGRALTRFGTVTLDGSRVTNPTTTTPVDNVLQPQTNMIFQNYPNPFNPSTRIPYYLGKAVQISLKVYNILGLEVATLVDGRQDAGSYTVQFNANNGLLRLSSGIYFYRLEAGSFIMTKKLIVIK